MARVHQLSSVLTGVVVLWTGARALAASEGSGRSEARTDGALVVGFLHRILGAARTPLRPRARADALKELHVREILWPSCGPLVLDQILEGDHANMEVAPATSDRPREGCFGRDPINRL